MFYPRAIGQIYLMAASVEAFGQSEWSLRLPSAICGVVLIVLAWLGGRRFLTPAWNLAFAAAVAFLPDFIDEAQTARMYVFLVASVAAYVVLIFEWERTGRTACLAGAAAVMLVGIQFHTLAIFAAPIVFVPPLLHADVKKLRHALVVFALMSCGFLAINGWISTQYPHSVEPSTDDPALFNGPKAGAAISHLPGAWIVAAALVALAIAAFVVLRRGGSVRGPANAQGAASGPAHLLASRPTNVRRVRFGTQSWPTNAVATALIAAGLTAQFALHYHATGLLIVAGLVVARRNGLLSARGVWVLAAVCVTVAVAQVAFLQFTTSVPLRP
jgi:hypothetical protein